jgi:CheY-like chemotaxis protein
MVSMPRILTVDPTGGIPHQVRAALDLMDRLVVQIDTPSANEALEEVQRAHANAVIAAWEPGDDMRGWELAAKIKQASPETAIIILADIEDPELDDEMESPFVYMRRPFDVPQFIRVLRAALNGEDVFAAMESPARGGIVEAVNMGPIPNINLDKATEIIDALQLDLNSMAILLVTREGDVLLERGTIGYMNRDSLAHTLVPAIMTNISMKEMVGGNCTSLQFFDGDEYDVFVLTVGLHHFTCIIFDGTNGARQFGAVNRFGRRSSEDLIALLGANAWIFQRPIAPEEPEEEQQPVRRRSQVTRKRNTAETEKVMLERASLSDNSGADDASEEGDEAEPLRADMPQLDAIPDEQFDLDAIFGEDMGDEADDLFDMDNLAEIAREDSSSPTKGALGYDQARELGLLD